MKKVLAVALIAIACSCSGDSQRALQTEAPTVTALVAAATAGVSMPWSAAAPFPGRESQVAPAHRRVGDRDEFRLRFADGSAMILSLAEPWGDPAELDARPDVSVQRPDGTKAVGGQVTDPQSLLAGVCLQNCVEVDQETRPDGGRNRRFQRKYPNREPSDIVMIEFENWATLVGSYESARAFTLETVDGFPVAHPQIEGYRSGPAKMYLSIRRGAVRMMIERMGAEACAERLTTERNDQVVSNSCIDDWHLYFDAAPDKAHEVRAALILRPADE